MCILMLNVLTDEESHVVQDYQETRLLSEPGVSDSTDVQGLVSIMISN